MSLKLGFVRCCSLCVQLRQSTPHSGSVLELLGTQRLLETVNLDLRVLSMAIAANVLSFSDTLLASREDCIDAFHDHMEILLGGIRRCCHIVPQTPIISVRQAKLCPFHSTRSMHSCIRVIQAVSAGTLFSEPPRSSSG